MLPENFNTVLIKALVNWLWRSWISFGVSGQGVSPARPDRVIDPESLLLASSLWARYEPRLFDEILDWLCLYGSLINLQRLRNLHRTGLGDSAVLSAMAAVVQKHSGQTKWKALLAKTVLQSELKPLFLDTEATRNAWGKTEPLFADYGFQRGQLELRQMSQPPSPQLAPNFWLKLRSLFGTTTRAEIMLQLLTGGPATASQVARRSSFTTRSVLLSLREIAQSGHLHEPPRPPRSRPQKGSPPLPRTRGLSLAYELRANEWNFLRTWTEPSGFPELKLSAPLLLLCQNLLHEVGAARPASSASMRSIQIRQSIASALKEIQRQSLNSEYGLPPKLSGDSLLSVLADCLPAVIKRF